MESVSRGTIKMPKWIIVLMAVAFMLIPMGSAFAETPFSTEGVDYVHWKTSNGTIIVYEFQSEVTKFYTGTENGNRIVYAVASGSLSTDKYRTWQQAPGQTSLTLLWGWTTFSGSANTTNNALKMSMGTVGDATLLSSSEDVFVDSTSSDVFFSNPITVDLVTVESAEEIPEAILANLHGGLLGLGLTILAIMLGVSLIPRLIHYFNR